MLRHLPFFEALGSLDESSADWRATSAGLVVLRLFDAWLDEGPETVAATSWGARAVREAIDAIPTGNPAARLLGGVLEAMAASPVAMIGAVLPRLMAYARALDFDGRYELAADVYRTIIAHTPPHDDPDIVIEAHIRLAYCARNMGRYDEAEAVYGQGTRLAESVGDIVRALRIRIAEAKLSLARGNLPQTESQMRAAVAAADAAGLTEIRGVALHELAVVHGLRGEYDRAIRFAYEALCDLTSPTARDRALGDLATAFMDLGVRSAARDAFLVLSVTAQEQWSRWQATINLLELSTLDRCEPLFERYRRELQDVELPPWHAAGYWLRTGEGYMVFGHAEAARAAFGRAIEVATRHQLNQYLFKAEQRLRELERGLALEARQQIDAPDDVVDVAAAVREMRREAGVSG